MSSPLIFVPKKLTQDVDFSPYLRQVISRNYSESPDAYSEQISTLNRSRQDALRGSAGSDITGRDLLYKYFGQLELLELRFPDLRVPFPWNDAFTQKQISQLSLAYEKASVIFNIGATLSSLAVSSPRTSPEGLKRSMYSFRCASGMFTYINDNFLHAPSTDLSREVVKVLIVLMGAQATEIFIEMTKGVGLKSKLCMSVSSMYAGIIEEVKEWSTKGVFIKDWYYLIQTKAKYFGSLAQFYRSTADITASKYGDSLARLAISGTLAKEALVLAKTFSSSFGTLVTATSLLPDSPSSMLELAKTHLALVTETKVRCQKDNDLVYNDVVPSEATLTPIEKAKDVAEPVPIHEVYASAEVQKIVGPDLFLKLVPLSVHESASMYSEEKAKLVRAEAERVDLAEGEMMAALEYMGLPASLERFKAGSAGQDGLTDPGGLVRSWSEEIRAEESRQGRLEDSFSKLESLKSRASNELERSGRDLETEARECEMMRVKYGHLWEQDPSSSLTRSYRQDLRSHRESLEQAATSDGVARGIWEGIRRDIGILVDPRALDRTFVEAVGSGQAETNLLDVDVGVEEEDEESKQKVIAIGEALSKLSKIKKERKDILKDLKERVQTDDISNVLVANRKGSSGIEPSIFATELEKFRPHQNRITATLQHQESTLAEIVADFKYVNEGKRAKEMQDRWGSAERQKKELIARLGRAKEAYSEVRVGIQKGIQFYQDLTELIEGLAQQVSSFLSQRNAERNQMASSADIKQRLDRPRMSSPPAPELDRRMGGLDLGGNRSPPPLAPPMMPPQQPSWNPPPQRQPSYSSAPSPQSAYSTAPPPSSPYQNFPSTGAFAAPSPPSNSYSSPPPQPLYSQPPPPVSQYQQYPSYSQPPPAHHQQQPQRQPSFPPTPQPISTPSYLPPPPPPVSYSSQTPSPSQYQPPQPNYPQYGQQQQQQQQPQYGNSAPSPPPPPPQQQQQSQYGQRLPDQFSHYGYQAPPPPRPNY